MSKETDLESVAQARELVERAAESQAELASLSQSKIDEIVAAMARAALEESHRLGEMAHLETGFGNASDKAAKNRFSSGKHLQLHKADAHCRSHQADRQHNRSCITPRRSGRDHSINQSDIHGNLQDSHLDQSS